MENTDNINMENTNNINNEKVKPKRGYTKAQLTRLDTWV
jgi:hypothetical protein